MNEIYVLINTTNGSTSHWTLPEILQEINRDRSEEWTDYDCSDWREGLEQFTEYRLVDKDNYPSGFPLVLSEQERKELTAYYLDTVKDEFLNEYPEPDDDEEMYWSGLQIGERMFDLCTYWMDGETVCVVYECYFIRDNWQTNTRHEWLLTEQNWV